ncbi:MAG: endonuclease [Flavobacteriaceae bacterium]|nr:endonuclease [Flavobacteriaceae bacterium]
MAKHDKLGKYGEQLAVDYLLDKNYKILESNYRFDRAEIDILAEKDGVLAVVEVKTRSSVAFGDPQEFVKPKQIKNLVKAVNHYIEVRQLDIETRFDIISITKSGQSYSVEHIENAFYHF